MGMEEGGGFRMGNICIPVADSFSCLRVGPAGPNPCRLPEHWALTGHPELGSRLTAPSLWVRMERNRTQWGLLRTDLFPMSSAASLFSEVPR